MKTFTAFISILYISINSFSQTQMIDSLKQQLTVTDDASRFELYYKLGYAYYIKSNLKEAVSNSRQAEQLAIKYRDAKQKALVQQDLGKWYEALSAYDRAMAYYIESLKYFDQQKDTFGILVNLNDLGNVYRKLNDTEKSISYLLRAEKLLETYQHKKLLSYTYNNIGATYDLAGEYRASIDYHIKSLRIKQSSPDSLNLFSTYNNIGSVYLRNKQYDKSINYFFKSIQLKQTKKNERTLGISYYNLGLAYKGLNQIDSAKVFFQECLKFSKVYTDYKHLKDANFHLSEIYEDKGDFIKSNVFLKQHLLYKDSLLNEQKQKHISELEILYEIEKKKQEVELLIAHKQIDAIKIKKREMLIIFSITLIVLLVISLSIFINRSRLKARLVEVEKDKNASILKVKAIEQQQLQNEIALKERELSTTTLHIVQKNELINAIYTKIEKMDLSNDLSLIKEVKKEIKHNDRIEQDWSTFVAHFESIYPDFFEQLKTQSDKLTSNDLRLCAYFKMNLSTKEIASLLNIEARSVLRARGRLKKKFALEEEIKLDEFIKSL